MLGKCLFSTRPVGRRHATISFFISISGKGDCGRTEPPPKGCEVDLGAGVASPPFCGFCLQDRCFHLQLHVLLHVGGNSKQIINAPQKLVSVPQSLVVPKN